MADRATRQRFGVLGVGAAACAACCAPPVIAFLAAAGLGALIGVALFGVVGLTVAAVAMAGYLRRQRAHRSTADPSVLVSLGRKPDA